MSQIDSGVNLPPAKPRSNIYTAMMAVAVIALGVGCGVVAYTNLQMVQDEGGENNPFHLVERPGR